MVLDTNILVYAADQNSEFFAPSRRFLNRRLSTFAPTFLTWGICYEFLRLTTHRGPFPGRLSAADAFSFLSTLMSHPGFSILNATDRHADVLTQTLIELPELSGNVMHDVHTAVLMRENGIREICTLDADFFRFPFLTVVDPLRR